MNPERIIKPAINIVKNLGSMIMQRETSAYPDDRFNPLAAASITYYSTSEALLTEPQIQELAA